MRGRLSVDRPPVPDLVQCLNRSRGPMVCIAGPFMYAGYTANPQHSHIISAQRCRILIKKRIQFDIIYVIYRVYTKEWCSFKS
jgi:hypothetical protein